MKENNTIENINNDGNPYNVFKIGSSKMILILTCKIFTNIIALIPSQISKNIVDTITDPIDSITPILLIKTEIHT